MVSGMAIYRNVIMSFWTDNKVVDDFTPEDKFFYLYLITNPHTNLCGCYEVSLKQMANETGYNEDTIKRLIERFSAIHNIIKYSSNTKEVLLLNWYRYNWTSSPKLDKPLLDAIQKVKNCNFRNYLGELYNGRNTVSIPYEYDIDTTVSVSVTDTVTDTVTEKPKKTKKPTKHKYGEYNNVLLTDEELEKLKIEYSCDYLERIENLSSYMESTGKPYKSHYATIRNWARKEEKEKANKKPINTGYQQSEEDDLPFFN